MKNIYLSESELQHFAQKIAEHITIRTYERGNSSDVTRITTKTEFEIIYNVAYGALLAFRWRVNSYNRAEIEYHLQSVLDTSEFILNNFIKDCNFYNTLYCPLKATIRQYFINPLHN